VTLDGTTAYDPDGHGNLTYQWTQISGPLVTITGADTPTPLISGFTQTSAIQKCTFELVVSDGNLMSMPSNVMVTIVPNFGTSVIRLINPPFSPAKPTIVAFGGGDGTNGWEMTFEGRWGEKANWFTASYSPPYEKYGDMLIVYLSSVAPNYTQPIQTIGFSTGGKPAIANGIYLNRTYKDPRYAINRVTLLDTVDSLSNRANFISSSVDGEQCWIDNYIAAYNAYCSGTLNITFPGGDHFSPVYWVTDSQYESSWPNNDMYNGGITAGFYYSVAGPGKNLQLATDTSKYYFKWINSGF
jgi:hypothetical protein